MEESPAKTCILKVVSSEKVVGEISITYTGGDFLPKENSVSWNLYGVGQEIIDLFGGAKINGKVVARIVFSEMIEVERVFAGLSFGRDRWGEGLSLVELESSAKE